MEEENELEQNMGSSTSGESEFVHVQSIDSSSSMDTTTLINQDDGVVVTRVDSGQDELNDERMTEDGGNEEFVDCPDDLVSYDGRSDFGESREAELVLEDPQIFADPTVNNRHSLFDSEKEILPNHYQEERRQLMTELTNLRYQLKPLIRKHPLISENDGGLFTDELTSILPLHEMIKNCSKFIELASSEQSQTDSTIKELYATLDTKDRQINSLNMKLVEASSVEIVSDRILSSFATVFGVEEFPDTSVNAKVSHIEKSTSILIQKYNHFLCGVEMLNQCLSEIKSDYHMQFDMDKVFFSVRDELVSLKGKEFELAHKSSYLEIEYGKLMQQLEKSRQSFEMLNSEIGNLKGEVEVQKNRFSNTKEKLNLAVTKGKSLVQQRDSLKQVLMEKTNELDKCLLDLQEKSSALEAANSLKEALLQRDTVLEKCEEILSCNGVGDELQSLDIIDKVTCLANERNRFLESFNMAKYEYIKLQDEINTTKEAARAEIDRITVSLLVESQEKNYLEEEFADLAHKYEELCVLKDKYGSLQADLQRSEDKSALLREKLSMAVKKGKGLVQERTEKNAQIDALKLELKQQETTMNDLNNQISKLSKNVGRIEKLESDLLRSKEKKDQIEQFLVESNTLLQSMIEAIDDIVVPVDVTEPVEKVKWCAGYFAKANSEKELRDVKDEAGRLTNALTTMKSLEDSLLVSEKHVFQLTEEKRELEVLKTKTEDELRKEIEDYHVSNSQAKQEVGDLKEEIAKLNDKLKEVSTTMKSLEDVISQLTEERQHLEISKSYVEEKLHKSLEEISSQTSQFQEIVASKNALQEALSVAEKNISVLMSEKEDAEMELQKVKDEVSTHVINLDEAHKTIKSLEDALTQETVASKNALQEALLVAENNISVLTSEKEDAKMELQKVKHEVSTHIINLDEAHRTIKSLEDALSQLHTHVSQFSNENEKAVDDKSLLENEIKQLKEVAACHEQKVTNTSTTVITLEEALLKAENTISDLIGEKKNAEKIVNNLQNDKQMQEKRVVMLEDDIKVLRFACADVTKEMKSLVENKLNYNPASDVGAVSDVAVADIKVVAEMLCAAKNARSVIEQCVDLKKNMSTSIKELHAELEKTRSLYDKVKEENDVFGNKVLKLDTELEDYRAKEDEWRKRDTELSKQITAFMKDHETENDLLSASEVKSLFNKINGITIPFPNIRKGDVEVNDSNSTKKLFYIVDCVTELVDQITLLSHSNENLHSTLSKQALEIEHLIEELEEAIKDRKEFEKIKKELFDLSIGFENLILKLGGEKPADLAGQLPVLEKLIHSIVLDNENSKAKLLETEKMVEELANKVKLLEDFDQNQTVIERGDTDSSSLPPQSEISEVEDLVSVGKRATPLVRTLRRESNDYLSVNIDSESDRFIDKQETIEDKGHIFKSLHTSGLVPPQGKIVADRFDGIWVSGSRALMSRPRARLGLIAYWLVLHLWLLGSLL